MRKFFTSAVLYFFIVGIILVIISETKYISVLLPNYVSPTSPLHTIIKTIGGALIGSGVFTVIIKSAEYSQIFSKIIDDIIWSKKYLKKREDKQEIWSTVSRLIYQEKFPLISDEIEHIITTEYFPTSHQYYIEDYKVIINIQNYNEHFWKHSETINATIKSINSKTKIPYNLISVIDLPPTDIEDVTSYTMDEFYINGKKQIIGQLDITRNNKYLTHTLDINLEGEEQYKLSLKREKALCKKTNPYKTFVSKSIIKNLNLTVILESGIDIDFHSRGTVNNFIELDEQINDGINILGWQYQGLILPHQGCILIFK